MGLDSNYVKSIKNLQIQRKDCSQLGQAIFDHMEKHQVSMNELARQVGCSQPALRSCFWHLANPQKKIILGLSRVLDIPYKDLQLWVFQDRLEYGYQVASPVQLVLAIEDIFNGLKKVLNSEKESSSDYELMHKAWQNVKTFAKLDLKSKK